MPVPVCIVDDRPSCAFASSTALALRKGDMPSLPMFCIVGQLSITCAAGRRGETHASFA